MRKREFWSFVGAGGKSTLLLLTAGQYARKGKRVLVTTTTHTAFQEEQLEKAGGCLLLGNDGEAAGALLERISPVAAVRKLPGEKGKQQGLSEPEMRRAMEPADLILAEADGSRHFPCKVPAEHEPAVHPDSTRILVIQGLTALGQPIGRCCHRPEKVCAVTGKCAEELLEDKDMAQIIRKGYLDKCRRLWPQIPVTVILNQADTEEQKRHGRRIREKLRGCGAEVFLFSARVFWEGTERWNMN